MILTYKGRKPLDDGRFVALPGDRVSFADDEAAALTQTKEWEVTADGGDRREDSGVLRTDVG